jgi:hypothetical protein
MKHIIKPLLGNGKKVISNGADVVAKNGKNGLNGNGNGLASSYAREQRALSKANASTPVQETEIFVPTNNLAKEQAVDNHLSKRRGSINVAMPIEELKERLTADLKNAGVKGEIDLMIPARKPGPLGTDAQTVYRNYQQEWSAKTDLKQDKSLYAELNGERYFGDVKNKKTGRLAIRSVRKKLDETVLTTTSRDLAIAEQTLDPADLKSWNRALEAAPRGWEAHHLNMVKLMSNMAEGLNPEGRRALYTHLYRRYGLHTGNSVYNKVNLPADIHDWVHAEMTKIGLDFKAIKFNEKTSIKERMKFVQLYVKQMDHIQRYIYKKMSARKAVRSKLRPENRQFRVN